MKTLAVLLLLGISSTGHSQQHSTRLDAMSYNGVTAKGGDHMSLVLVSAKKITGELRPEIGLSQFIEASEETSAVQVGLAWWPTLVGSYSVVGGCASSLGGATLSRSVGVNASRWLFDERYEVAVGATKSTLNQPSKSFLDVDAKLVQIPGYVVSDQAYLNQKFLINTTQTASLNYSISKPSNRPMRSAVVLGTSKVFAPRASLHLNTGWLVDHSQVDRATNYGKVDSKYVGLDAYYQLLASTTIGVTSRVYVEKETPRYTEDSYLYGSDTVGLNIRYTAMKFGMHKYVSNRGVRGTAFEAGVGASF